MYLTRQSVSVSVDATRSPVSNYPNAVARMENGKSSIGCRPTESAAILKDYAQSEMRIVLFEVVRNVVVLPCTSKSPFISLVSM